MSSLLKYGNFYWEECKKESFRNSENLFIHLIYALCHSIQVPSHLYNGIANITLDPSYHRAEILCLKKSQSLNQVSRAHRASHWQAWALHGSACTLELCRLGRIGYTVSLTLWLLLEFFLLLGCLTALSQCSIGGRRWLGLVFSWRFAPF